MRGEPKSNRGDDALWRRISCEKVASKFAARSTRLLFATQSGGRAERLPIGRSCSRSRRSLLARRRLRQLIWASPPG